MLVTHHLEARILEGPAQYEHEDKHKYRERRANAIADRLCWLKLNNCTLNIDYDTEIARLKIDAPAWRPEGAENADSSMEIRSGWIQTEKGHSALLDIPISDIITKALELGGRTEDFYRVRDPFAGLCESYLNRAIFALHFEAKNNHFPQMEWQRFLNFNKRKDDDNRLKYFIAYLILTIPDSSLKGLLCSVSRWLLTASENIPMKCVPIFERLVKRLLGFLKENPQLGGSGIVRGNKDPNWAMEALNSPVGNVAQALSRDPRLKDLDANQTLPPEWIVLVEAAMELDDDNGRFALVFFTSSLNRYHFVDPKWTNEKLLVMLEENHPNTLDAWWAGYLLRAQFQQNLELFKFIKPHLLAKTKSTNQSKYENNGRLANIILSYWACPEPKTGVEQISNDEFRRVLLESGEGFRSEVLWKIASYCNDSGNMGQFWRGKRIPFLKLWPLQLSVRTPQSLARLIEFVFSDQDAFMDLSEAILPLLSPIIQDDAIPHHILLCNRNIIDKYPEQVLKILFAALPKKAISRRPDIDSTLDRIVCAGPELKYDNRMVQLKQRWSTL